MNYIEKLNVLGLEARQRPCLKGSDAPTETTVGTVGELYMDTDTGLIYKCVGANEGVYTWQIVGMSEEEKAEILAKIKEVGENIKNPDYNQNDETQPDYIKNRPDIRNTESDGIVLGNIESNEAHSANSVAGGENNISGVRGYYYSNIVVNDDKSATIYLTDNQEGIHKDDLVIGYEAGDVISIVTNYNYDNCATITAVDNENKSITVSEWIYGTMPTIENPSINDYSLFVAEKPSAGVVSLNPSAFAEGNNNRALGEASHAEGIGNTALGKGSHAEGQNTIAYYSAHSEGFGTQATEYHAHAEGYKSMASGNSSHAEGWLTVANRHYAHAEGYKTESSGLSSHAEGYNTKATTYYSHAEGLNTTASGVASHAEGQHTIAASDSQHVQGKYNVEDANGEYAHIVGNGKSDSKRSNAYTLDWKGNAQFAGEVTDGNGNNFSSVLASQGVYVGKKTEAGGEIFNDYSNNTASKNSHAEGLNTTASGETSHAEGYSTKATNYEAHAEGRYSKATGIASHSEGEYTIAQGQCSHAEGDTTEAIGIFSHAEGRYSKATGTASHAEGYKTTVSGSGSHAEGYTSEATGLYGAHAEGLSCKATGASGSHAEGNATIAKGQFSHSEGWHTIASANAQHVQGKYNIEDTEKKHAHIVGNGKSDTKRSNAHTLDWDGNAWYAGTVETTGVILKSPNGTRFTLTVADDGTLKTESI